MDFRVLLEKLHYHQLLKKTLYHRVSTLCISGRILVNYTYVVRWKKEEYQSHELILILFFCISEKYLYNVLSHTSSQKHGTVLSYTFYSVFWDLEHKQH